MPHKGLGACVIWEVWPPTFARFELSNDSECLGYNLNACTVPNYVNAVHTVLGRLVFALVPS